MKYVSVLTLSFAGCFWGCTPQEKQDITSGSEFNIEWPAMDDFHLIMAEAFHPYKDSANLEPARKLADELVEEAEKWASSPLPEKVDNEEMKVHLNQLLADCRALEAITKRSDASDEEMGAALSNLHNHFHEIMENWNGGKHEHHHK